jgi:HD superfamily phosphohydrolase
MLNVHNDEIVIDEKGIYSVEKFLIARRLMYWQVYLHKTVIAAESLMVKVLQRAVFLAKQGVELFATPAFHMFLYQQPSIEDFFAHPQLLKLYSELDDYDIFASVKVWCNHPDPILSRICKQLVNRDLPRIEISQQPFAQSLIDNKRKEVAESFHISEEDAQYFVFSDSVKNKAYSPDDFTINVLYKNGETVDIANASDLYNISALATTVTKYFLCYPKNT